MMQSKMITIAPNLNLPLYTISEKTIVEGRYVRQTSSMDCFAIVTLKIEPYQGNGLTIFHNRLSEIDAGYKIFELTTSNDSTALISIERDASDISNTICLGIWAGIEKFNSDLIQKKQILLKIKITLLKAKYHPVDSRSQCYKIATHSALLKALEQTNLTKISS